MLVADIWLHALTCGLAGGTRGHRASYSVRGRSPQRRGLTRLAQAQHRGRLDCGVVVSLELYTRNMQVFQDDLVRLP